MAHHHHRLVEKGPTMATPIVAVDIDGVLLTGANRYPGNARTVRWEFPDGSTPARTIFPVAGVSAMLNRLAEHAELVWCTSWPQWAVEHLTNELHLPHIRYIDVGQSTIAFGRQVKIVRLYGATGATPVAVLDDQIGPRDLMGVEDRPTPTLLRQVNPARGLTATDVDVVIGWTTELTDGDTITVKGVIDEVFCRTGRVIGNKAALNIMVDIQHIGISRTKAFIWRRADADAAISRWEERAADAALRRRISTSAGIDMDGAERTVWAWISTGPRTWTSKDAADAISGYSHTTIIRVLRRFRTEGLITKVNNSTYRNVYAATSTLNDTTAL